MRPLLIACAAVSVVVLAGCGGSKSKTNGVESKSANDIVAAAKAAAESATSVHAAGSGSDNGVPLQIDLHLVAGKGGTGRLAEHGLSFDLIRVGPTAYIKGSTAFYKQFAGAGAAQLFKGKWLKAPANSGDFAQLASLTDLRKFFDSTLVRHGALQKGATTTVRGIQVIGVKDTTQGGTLYVATTGQPYPVQISKTGSQGGTLTFDQWNQAVTLKAPANAVDVSKLKG